ncbi:MAG TPA: prolipoprotein diacylglyceryl transferase family protein [Gemmataceae bacterium]|nr:prolipoprotein diacylglyceryl transferase family protein [Gemmataceae bacterium]
MTPRLLYALFMFAALAVFVGARRWVAKPPELEHLPWWKKLVLATAGLAGGVLGAKLPFVLTGDYAVASAHVWLSDGKTIVTGLIGAYLAVELAKLALGIRIKTGDTYAVPLALALAVGRWGCFCNGCCYGTPTSLPWGVDFGDGILRHPTQIYESIFDLVMAVILWALASRALLPRQRLKLFLIAYGFYRLATELIRPEPVWLWNLTFYQAACLVLIVALLVQWIIDSRRAELALSAPAVGSNNGC